MHNPELVWSRSRGPVGDAIPIILVALRHSVMRRWTSELLTADFRSRVVEPISGELLIDAIARTQPDLVVVDSVDFASCCLAALDGRTVRPPRLPPDRVVVIGPEPDPLYRSRALNGGAGGWVCRDEIGEKLGVAIRDVLGCPDGL
jgi:DNA-binding NarL/FixJ family response regulator